MNLATWPNNEWVWWFASPTGDASDGDDGAVRTLLGVQAARQADQATPAR